MPYELYFGIEETYSANPDMKSPIHMYIFNIDEDGMRCCDDIITYDAGETFEGFKHTVSILLDLASFKVDKEFSVSVIGVEYDTTLEGRARKVISKITNVLAKQLWDLKQAGKYNV